ncbi:hypothetical protein [Halalkalibacter okhensis]|uniref:Uncharacterized protein n=1 Tax=Halalkalibacter okhensis TaxID=333138 RepID=A0A0B0IC69_9BACI|nr:hypothetical protein [Halalkalibacter okhensis]KHF40188.1 hypothetical protein LQ50_10595 [Halalkalibacter okhensis]
MNKVAYMFVGAIFTVIISIGYLTFADTKEPSQSEQITQEALTVKKTVTEVEEVDTVEEIPTSISEENPILLSSSPEDESKVAMSDMEQTEESSQSNGFTQAAKGLARAEGLAKAKGLTQEKGTQAKGKQTAVSFLEQLEKLEIELENEKIEIEIKQERKKNRVKSEVEIEWEDEKIKLKNKQADVFIDDLFALTPIQSAEELPTLAQEILAQYGVEAESVEVKIKAEKADGKKYEYENN